MRRAQGLFPLQGAAGDTVVMLNEQRLWERIRRHAGEPFETKKGKPSHTRFRLCWAILREWRIRGSDW